MKQLAINHIAAVAEIVGIKISKAEIGMKIRYWLDRPNDPDRIKIEAFDGGAFKSMLPGWRAWNAVTQPELVGVYAVTSLSPKPQHLKKQPTVLASWRRFGLRIISVNTTDEIQAMRDVYPEVAVWVASDDQGSEYKTPTQRINSLVSQAEVAKSAVLLINSDIEIYGDQRRIKTLIEQGRNAVGIRYNYEISRDAAYREPWGLDAMLMTQESAMMVDQAPYAIGKPFWDYWIVWLLKKKGVDMEWIGEPMFYHESHPIHWNKAEWQQGSEWFIKTYGFGTNWLLWRESMPYPPARDAYQRYKVDVK